MPLCDDDEFKMDASVRSPTGGGGVECNDDNCAV